MTVRRRTAAGAVAVAALLTSACGAKAPDYQSIWSTTPTSLSSASTPGPPSTEPPVPFSDYLERLGVRGEPIATDKLTEVTVTMPYPKGWQRYTDPSSAPGTVVIARNNTYPTATLVAFKLHGDFDVADAIKHANTDATTAQKFTKLNESFTNFGGFPSAMIEGSYDNANGDRLHTYNRIVIPVTKTFQRYLVQLTVTSKADQAVADADDIQAIIDGFKVTAP